jgi:hypothetical protein
MKQGSLFCFVSPAAQISQTIALHALLFIHTFGKLSITKGVPSCGLRLFGAMM